MKKFAYLLIVHEYTYVLEILLKCLDDERNDIFLHIDRKTKQFPVEKCKKLVTRSNLIIVPGVSVFWGGYSQIEAEMLLLETAVRKQHYQYYHLLSGSDLPLASQNNIHSFFDENEGKEFIRFQEAEFKYADRIKYYYFGQKFNARRKNKPAGLAEKIVKVSCAFQRIIGVDRNKNISFQKGTNWFSITDEFARYIVSKRDWVKSVFKYTFCADELFLQTILINSKFIDNLYHPVFDNDKKAIMRYIDWERGNPYTFRKEDFDDLIHSGMLFARKFSENTDKDIVDLIYHHVNV